MATGAGGVLLEGLDTSEGRASASLVVGGGQDAYWVPITIHRSFSTWRGDCAMRSLFAAIVALRLDAKRRRFLTARLQQPGVILVDVQGHPVTGSQVHQPRHIVCFYADKKALLFQSTSLMLDQQAVRSDSLQLGSGSARPVLSICAVIAIG